METNHASQRNSTVLCAVTHGLYMPWTEILTRGQIPTWLSLPMPDGFEVIHFHGRAGGKLIQLFDKLHEKLRWTNRWTALPLRIFDEFFGTIFRLWIPKTRESRSLNNVINAIEIDLLDVYATMKWKDLAIFNYFIEKTNFDFLFMTTTSSYIRPNTLLNEVRMFPKSGVYAGALAYKGADFAAGHNRLFSRDVVQRIIDARGRFQCSVVEDLAVGKLCRSLNIPLSKLSKIDINSLEMLNSFTDQEISGEFHFRLKSGSPEKRQDVAIMRQLHERVRLIDGC